MHVGVIGVGSMGRHHARVYSELMDATLGGVHDQDVDAAETVATEYGTRALGFDQLLETADAVSIAVPTTYHHSVTKTCLEHGLDVLVEKPFVDDLSKGEELIDLANRRDCTLQVGHIERFNPATMALDDILGDEDILAIDIKRLGPPRDRNIEDSAVLDLMIHDLDIVRALLDGNPDEIDASGKLDNRYATTTLTYIDGPVVTVTASRVTQRKVRTMEITTEDRLIAVDFIDKSVEIHRHSTPQYIEEDGDIRYRHEGIIERPMVSNGEPLKHELESFIDAAMNGHEPEVTARDGIEAMKLAQEIDALARTEKPRELTPT